MPLSMRTEPLDLAFAEPFHIARPEESLGVRTIAVELDLDGVTGLGECYPLAWYGETPETTWRSCRACWVRSRRWVRCRPTGTRRSRGWSARPS